MDNYTHISTFGGEYLLNDCSHILRVNPCSIFSYGITCSVYNSSPAISSSGHLSMFANSMFPCIFL